MFRVISRKFRSAFESNMGNFAIEKKNLTGVTVKFSPHKKKRATCHSHWWVIRLIVCKIGDISVNNITLFYINFGIIMFPWCILWFQKVYILCYWFIHPGAELMLHTSAWYKLFNFSPNPYCDERDTLLFDQLYNV